MYKYLLYYFSLFSRNDFYSSQILIFLPFIRFHNIIREEYQYEKEIVEDRIEKWSTARLMKEGFTIIDLTVYPRGNLFQEKVFRFSCSSNDDKLPFHQFAVGDGVRITTALGDPLSPDSIDGVLLDRRQKYLDICLNNSDSNKIDSMMKYRLDCMVNRVTYDRQIEALQTFLTPPSVGVLGVSRAVRDIMLYSYPNSMIQLANTPGGLKMALPLTNTTNSPELNMGSEESRDKEVMGNEIESGSDVLKIEEDEVAVLSATLHRGREMTGVKVEQGGVIRYRQRGSEEDSPEHEKIMSQIARPIEQLQQQLFSKSSKGKKILIFDPNIHFNSSSSDNSGNGIDSNNNINHLSREKETEISTENFLHSNFENKEAFLPSFQNQKVSNGNEIIMKDESFDSQKILVSGDDAIGINPAVFTTNERLREMAETFTGSAKVIPYSNEEIDTVIELIVKQHPMNESQLLSLKKAIHQTVSLIQGPPGTGKTRTACSILAVTVALKDQRLSLGGQDAVGLKLQKVLACAHSNIAADNLLEGLVAQKVNVVRLGMFSTNISYINYIYLSIISLNLISIIIKLFLNFYLDYCKLSQE